MKLSIIVLAVGVVLSLGVIVGSGVGVSQAQEAPKIPFEHVVPFTTTGGFFGFFNQADGKVYLYDAQLERLVLEAEMAELGKPPKVIRSNFSVISQENLEYKK